MHEYRSKVVAWVAADCTPFGVNGTHLIPLAIEPDQLQRGLALEITIPSIAAGILLSVWRSESKLETSQTVLSDIFHGLLKFTDCDSIRDFAASAAEEIRDEFGPQSQVLALAGAASLGVIDEIQLSNALGTTAAIALDQ
ncbi:MAG: hypothetical protein ABIS50_05085 [Luteolibacter sp.]|uniref:hypothetical protein n=1 Tax=Luteolibacter sp. TaxID=1962973 RepID=UPI003267CAF2